MFPVNLLYLHDELFSAHFQKQTLRLDLHRSIHTQRCFIYMLVPCTPHSHWTISSYGLVCIIAVSFNKCIKSSVEYLQMFLNCCQTWAKARILTVNRDGLTVLKPDYEAYKCRKTWRKTVKTYRLQTHQKTTNHLTLLTLCRQRGTSSYFIHSIGLLFICLWLTDIVLEK